MKGTTRLNSLALGKVPFLLVFFLFCFVGGGLVTFDEI